MEYRTQEIKKCHEEYLRLVQKCYLAIDAVSNNSNPQKNDELQFKSDMAERALNDFSEKVYAKAIYQGYSEENPTLVNVRNGKKIKWSRLFKPSFDKLDRLDKSLLVGLVEGNGSYKIV